MQSNDAFKKKKKATIEQDTYDILFAVRDLLLLADSMIDRIHGKKSEEVERVFRCAEGELYSFIDRTE